MIAAWGGHKNFVRKDGGGSNQPLGHNPEVNFNGEERLLNLMWPKVA